MLCSSDLDQQVLYFQKTGDSNLLIKEYNSFLNKYYRMFSTGQIDFGNKDIRIFISCFLKTEAEQRYFVSSKVKAMERKDDAQRIVDNIRKAFSHYERNKDQNKDELFHELMVPFLMIAARYEKRDKTFDAYKLKAYPYELKRHVEEFMVSITASEQVAYSDEWNSDGEDCDIQLKEKGYLDIYLDEDLKLNNPDWLSGKTANEPFKSMSRMDRLILAKYYYEDQTDKDIGRLVGRNLKSINRARNRLKQNLENELEKGDIKWLGIRKS